MVAENDRTDRNLVAERRFNVAFKLLFRSPLAAVPGALTLHQ